MKPLRTGSVVLGLALITFVAGTAAADDKVVTYGFSTDYFSKYIWRGQNVDNSSVLQPAFSASAYGFTGSIWSNIDMTNRSKTAPDNAWEFSEYDLTLDYTGAIPGFNWLSGSVGTIYYQFPNTQLNPTTEIYGGFSLTHRSFNAVVQMVSRRPGNPWQLFPVQYQSDIRQDLFVQRNVHMQFSVRRKLRLGQRGL